MKIKIQHIIVVLISLYSILPGYFRIFGVSSNQLCALIIVLLLAFYKLEKKQSICKEVVKYVFAFSILEIIPFFVHQELGLFISSLVEDVLLIILISDYMIRNAKCINRILEIITWISTILSILGLGELVSGVNVFGFLFNGTSTDMTPNLQSRVSLYRSETLFGHAITFAIYLSFCSLLLMHMYIHTYNKRYLIQYIVNVLGIISTISRAPILIFFLAQCIYLFSFGPKIILKYFGIISGALLLFFVLAYMIAPGIIEMTSDIIMIFKAMFSDSAAKGIKAGENANPFDYRLGLIDIVSDAVKNNMLFGNGVSLNFRFDYKGFKQFSIDNGYLYVLLRYGYVGLIGFLLSLIIPLKLLLHCIKKTFNKKRDILIVYIVVILDYILNLFSVAQMYEVKIYRILVAIIIALYVGLLNKATCKR